MASITLTSVTFDSTPASAQTATVKHRLTSDADISGSYTTDSTSVSIGTNGTLSTPLVISGLANNTSYTLWITTSCASFKKAFTTPLVECATINNMTATVA